MLTENSQFKYQNISNNSKRPTHRNKAKRWKSSNEKRNLFNYHILVEMYVTHCIRSAIRCTKGNNNKKGDKLTKQDMNHVHIKSKIIIEASSDFNNIARKQQLCSPCFTRIFKTISKEKKRATHEWKQLDWDKKRCTPQPAPHVLAHNRENHNWIIFIVSVPFFFQWPFFV